MYASLCLNSFDCNLFAICVRFLQACSGILPDDGEDEIPATITALGEDDDGSFYLNINIAFTSPSSGKECYINYSLTR